MFGSWFGEDGGLRGMEMEEEIDTAMCDICGPLLGLHDDGL